MKLLSYGILFGILLTIALPPAIAQDDDYSEYSHLWEDPKEAAKRKKQEAKELKKLNKERIRQGLQPLDSLDQIPPELLQLAPADTLPDLPTDSIPEVVQDTIPSTPADTIPQDSLRQPPELTETPGDTIPVESVPQEPVIEDSEEEVPEEAPEEMAEDEAPREKKSLEAVAPDFRSGMAGSGGSTVNAGFTYTQIGDEAFVGLTLQPELSIWKIGVGLNVPVLYSLDNRSFRTEIFKDGVGVARLISYLRYGVQKFDPVYIKVGQLDGTMIGFGGLVNNYTNSTSFEKRKLGLHYDVNFKGLAGLEGMYSDFDPSSKNLLVTRPYVRPLSFLSVPIVRTIEFGAAIVSDEDQTEIATSDSTFVTYDYTKGGIGALGLDAGITLLNVPFIQIDAFYTWSKLRLADSGLQESIDTLSTTPPTLEDGYQEGTGSSYGVNFRFKFIADVFSTDLRIERLSYSEHYLPQFFNTNYELDKDARIWSTVTAPSKSGIYGSLTGHVLDKLRLGGSLMIPDDISLESPAQVQVNADMERLADKFSLHGSYFKGNLATLSDAFKLDHRSVAKVRFIYHMNRFLGVGLDYYWAFAPTSDGSVEATRYVSPYFGLSMSF